MANMMCKFCVNSLSRHSAVIFMYHLLHHHILMLHFLSYTLAYVIVLF